MTDAPEITSARAHVAELKRTFGDLPSWGMVEMAYRTGWYAANGLLREPLIDPDCRDGKCGSCVGGPCEHGCHGYASGGVGDGPPGAVEVTPGQLHEPPADVRHAHYYRQTVAGLVCACGAMVTT